MQWITHCRDILDKGITQVNGPSKYKNLVNYFQVEGAFQTHTSNGPVIILPNRYADQIHNNPDLLLSESAAEVCVLKVHLWLGRFQ
jgi:hypothetical protein